MTPRPTTLAPPASVENHPRRGALIRLLQLYRPRVCVEVGSDVGFSAIIIGTTIRSWGGTLWCVDPWEECEGYTGDYTDRYDAFLSNIWQAGLEMVVTPLIGASEEVSELVKALVKDGVDFIYIDALHDYESVKRDLACWEGALAPGGILAGDNYGMPGITAAWDEFAGERSLTIVEDNRVVRVKFPLDVFHNFNH